VRRADGFTLVEALVATALMLLLVAVVFVAVAPTQDAASAQTEAADIQQRVRVAAERLYRDLLSAGSSGTGIAAIFPYRTQATGPDPPGTVKPDVVTIVSAAGTVTYWLKAADAGGVPQLMMTTGAASPDIPVVDHVVGIGFEYFGDPQPPALVKPLDDPQGPWTTYGPRPSSGAVAPFGPGENCVFVDDGSGTPAPRLATLAAGEDGLAPLSPAQLSDGPWCPDDTAADRWDADLLRIRSIAVTVRAQAALASLRGPPGVLFRNGGTASAPSRWAPDLEIVFRVSPRNLNLRP
jgi:type II secretory pathway pseudopilin PulG